MSKICIVGASGTLGQYMVQHALDRGDEALGVRRDQSAGKLDRFNGRISGDVERPSVSSRNVLTRAELAASAKPPKRLARAAGVLYLLVGIFGGFAEGYVEPKMYVAGDAAATAGNVVANSGLVRLGVVADLLDQTLFVFLAMTLYPLLKHVRQSVARAMVVLVVIASAISCLNTVFELEGLRVATDSSYAAAFGTAGANALVLLLLDAQHHGILIAQIFFGMWLVPLGYLACKSSGMFPKWLGVLLIVGGICYLVDVLVLFLVPDFGQQIAPFVVVPSAIAEISMVLYLLVIGVESVESDERILGAAC
jgi:NAD(P)-dependent dehydrogenase (short-subunit alcohol dehydrogenase family)